MNLCKKKEDALDSSSYLTDLKFAEYIQLLLLPQSLKGSSNGDLNLTSYKAYSTFKGCLIFHVMFELMASKSGLCVR